MQSFKNCLSKTFRLTSFKQRSTLTLSTRVYSFEKTKRKRLNKRRNTNYKLSQLGIENESNLLTNISSNKPINTFTNNSDLNELDFVDNTNTDNISLTPQPPNEFLNEYVKEYENKYNINEQNTVSNEENETKPLIDNKQQKKDEKANINKQINERVLGRYASIKATLKGIYDTMASLDQRNIVRIDKTYKKLLTLESLHIKNIQHNYENIMKLIDELEGLNSRIDNIFKRIDELESTSPNEWLEWTVPKYEIPYDNNIYLRSPGYEVGSMVWCIELRWEIDNDIFTKEHNVNINQENTIDSNSNEKKDKHSNIIDLRPDSEIAIDETLENQNLENENQTLDNENDSDFNRQKLGYSRLGVYVSPRSVSNFDSLESLKATCEVRINDFEFEDSLTLSSNENNINNEYSSNINDDKKLHFSVSGDFVRGNNLISWGRTLPKGDNLFVTNKNISKSDESKVRDSQITIKLKINSQTLSYKSYINDSNSSNNEELNSNIVDSQTIDNNITTSDDLYNLNEKINDNKITFDEKEINNENLNSSDKQEEEIQYLMTIPLEDFWKLFNTIPNDKMKNGVSINKIHYATNIDIDLLYIFRMGPLDEKLKSIKQQIEKLESMNLKNDNKNTNKDILRNISSIDDDLRLLSTQDQEIKFLNKILNENKNENDSNNNNNDSNNNSNDNSETDSNTKKLNSKKRYRKLKQQREKFVRLQQQWNEIVEHDRKYPEFRRKLAKFLVVYNIKLQNIQNKKNEKELN